jgi:mannose-6-phosphate isomerase-like protein (cupin superfamily)
MTAPRLEQHPIHLGLGATAVSEPAFTGIEWYAGYVDRHAADGAEGRLVSMYTFDESWDSWEVHPDGEEVVLCVTGSITLHQEHADGTTATVTLGTGEYAINPKGTWHTADVTEPCTCLFITPGVGTEHRER